ncbi:MAG: 16S rRNA (guanine(966)-N(2))-methyltransferase RsmD [Bermanella sp.]
MAKKSGNRLRIIGGQWRSRFLPFPDVDGLRPTTDRVRETLFNWLQPVVHGAAVLDVFAGSGALGFEALSRGARSLTLIEKNPKAAQQLSANIQTLNATTAQVKQTDALHYLAQPQIAQPQTPFDLIFLDPPFSQGLLPECIALIESNGLLADDGWIYIESEQDLASLNIPPHWDLHREKKAGQVRLCLYCRRAAPARKALED